MLSELYIENVAVIERAEVRFLQGLNVLTGETGAGKSILIDSINAIIGNRTSREIVRTGCDKAVIWAVFDNCNSEVSTYLSEMGYDSDESLVIYREIMVEKGSKCRINNRPATAAAVRELCSMLINIHGQHDNQELLNPERHIHVFDRYSGLSDEVTEFSGIYRRAEAVKKTLDSMRIDDSQKQRKMDLLRYQIDEIEAAKLTVKEDEELSNLRNVIKNSEKILESLNTADRAFKGEDGQPGILEIMYGAADALSDIAAFSDDYSSVHIAIDEEYYSLSDISERISRILSSFEYDASTLTEIEERLDNIFMLKRKYGETIEDILEFQKNSISELENLDSSEALFGELEAEYMDILDKIDERASVLSEKRKNSFCRFEDEIKTELSYLDMEGARFTVNWSNTDIGPLGRDKIEFFLSTNVGEPEKSLSKIVSGGELSRIMLAIKNVMADKDNIGTLIFDEIDTGISGKSAYKIGDKLRQSARSRQTICVTHSAQIASYADGHYYISKAVQGGRTYTSVRALGHQERILELARIISGDNVTEISLNNADEMLRLANSNER